MESNCPPFKYGAHRHLLTGLLFATLAVPGYFVLRQHWATQNYLDFGLMLTALGLYWLNCGIPKIHEYYARHQHRGYFLVSFLIVALAIYAGQSIRLAWILCLPVASQAILNLPLRKAPPVIVALLAISFYPFWPVYLSHCISILFSFGVTLIFSWMLRRENDRRMELEAAHEQLRAYSAQAETLAAAEERARLAREIHDGVAHHLTSANVLVAAGLAQLPAGATADARDSLEKAQSQIRAALGEIRQSIAERRDASPVVPLAQRIEDLIAAGNFPATFTLTGTPRRLTTEAELGFYRVAQEALTNASKHAPGEPIAVHLTFAEPAGATLRIANREPAQSASGDGAFGLLSLRERLTQLGGRFTAGPTPAGRFVVEAEIPA